MNSIWIARDEDGVLCAFSVKPERDILSHSWVVLDDAQGVCIPDDWFPGLKWEDEPIELVIKGKED